MSTYTISNTKLIPNRVFILQKSELENSLSPLYYSTLPKKLNFSKKLKDIAFVNPLRRKPVFADDELVPYVGLPQTDEHSKSIINVILRPYKEVKGRNIIYPNDLLFARIEPSIFNKKYILTKDLKGYDFAFTSTEFYIVKGKDIDNEYLLANFLSDYVYKQVEGKTTGSTGRRRLDKSVFADLVFPFPKSRDRKKVSEIIAKYFALKKQNEAKAKKLLASIDNYLLEELGIKLPELPENTLENRMFTVSLKDISGGRFDPKLYDNNTQAIRNAIEKTNFDKPKLKELVTSSMAGDWGKDENENLADNFKRCLVIRATEFDNLYNLNLDNSRVKYRLINSGKLDRIDIQENDLLIEKSGGSPDQPVGRISILTNDILKIHQIGYSNFIHKIRVDNSKINSEYLFCFLKTVHNIKLTDAMQSQTNGIRNLIMSNYFNQIIPLPKIDKQKEIANHISEIRKQAQKLKDQTAEALKNASNEIERILLN